VPYKERCDFIYSTIKPGYAKIRELMLRESIIRESGGADTPL